MTDLTTFARELLPRLSREELVEVRAVFIPEGTDARPADYLAARPIGTVLERARQSWLPALLAEDRLVTHFQPIVEAGAPHTIFGYECLMRGLHPYASSHSEGSTLIYPDELLAAAHGADLLFQLDLAARLAAIRGTAAHGFHELAFINFCPAAIYDPAFCLRSTIAAVGEAGLRPEQIVFEVTESERVPGATSHLRNILDHYRSAGFRVALDDVGAGYSSLVLLGDVRPDFVKLDKELTAGVVTDAFRAVIAEQLIGTALRTGMSVIAEGIEDASAAEWFRARGVQYLQGYHFARPAAVPPSATVVARSVSESVGGAPKS